MVLLKHASLLQSLLAFGLAYIAFLDSSTGDICETIWFLTLEGVEISSDPYVTFCQDVIKYCH